MKIKELLENEDPTGPAPNTPGEHIVNIEQLEELFAKYKFLSYNADPESGWDCEFAVILDIPATIKKEQFCKLINMADPRVDEQNATYEWDETKTLASILPGSGYAPGLKVCMPGSLKRDTSKEHLFFVTLMHFEEWVEYFVPYIDRCIGQDDDFEL